MRNLPTLRLFMPRIASSSCLVIGEHDVTDSSGKVALSLFAGPDFELQTAHTNRVVVSHLVFVVDARLRFLVVFFGLTPFIRANR